MEGGEEGVFVQCWREISEKAIRDEKRLNRRCLQPNSTAKKNLGGSGEKEFLDGIWSVAAASDVPA